MVGFLSISFCTGFSTVLSGWAKAWQKAANADDTDAVTLEFSLGEGSTKSCDRRASDTGQLHTSESVSTSVGHPVYSQEQFAWNQREDHVTNKVGFFLFLVVLPVLDSQRFSLAGQRVDKKQGTLIRGDKKCRQNAGLWRRWQCWSHFQTIFIRSPANLPWWHFRCM